MRRYEPLPDEAPPHIKLPWVVSSNDPLRDFIEAIAIPSGLIALVVLVIPVWLVRETLTRGVPVHAGRLEPQADRGRPSFGRCVMLGLLLGAYAALCVSPALFGFQQAVTSLLAFTAVIGLAYRAIRERTWQPAALAGGLAVLLVVPLAVLHVLGHQHPLAQQDGWGSWWWLDELTGERLLLALVSLPGVLFWWSLLKAYRSQDRRTASRLLITATLVAAILAAVTLAADSRQLSTEQRYSLEGWPTIWFWGVLVIGLWLLVYRGFRWIMSRRRAYLQKRKPQHA
jgi:hypothetical protein